MSPQGRLRYLDRPKYTIALMNLDKSMSLPMEVQINIALYLGGVARARDLVPGEGAL